MPQIDLSILNQRQTPAFYADVLANRPPAGFIGRIFVSTNTFEFYRDNGTGWDIIGGPGAGTVTGGGSLYRVAIWNSTSSIGESNNLIFDFSTNRLGIGTNAPGTALDVHSTQSTILQLNQTSINDTRIAFQLSGAALWRIGNFYNGGANDFELFDVIGAQAAITVKKTSGQVLIGTTTVGSGKLVVASSTGDNGVQIVGASAPSLRIDNAASGPTKRAGLGISTAVNNFIQGSADRDFCIFNGSTTAASPILFGVYDTGLTNVQEAARFSAARNFLVNTTTDSGFRLDVNGTVRFNNTLNVGNSFLIGLNAQCTFERISNVSRVILSSQNVAGARPAYLFSVDSVQLDRGLINNRDNSYIALVNGANSNSTNYTERFFVFNTGNCAINTATDAGFRLDVNGTARVQGVITGSVAGGTLTLGAAAANSPAINISGNFTSGGAISTSNSNNRGYDARVNVQDGGAFWAGGHFNGQAVSNTNAFFRGTGSINISNGTVGNNFNGVLFDPTITAQVNTVIYAFRSTLAAATDRWNLYISGSADNYLQGNLLIGTPTSGASKLRIVGLPTSAAGLSSGDVYSNLGVLTIVP